MKRVVISVLFTICSIVNMQASDTPTEKDKLLTKLEAVHELTEKLLATDLSAGTVKVLTEHYQELTEKIKDEKFKEDSAGIRRAGEAFWKALDARTKLINDLYAQHCLPRKKASVTSSYQEPAQAIIQSEGSTSSISQTKQPAESVVTLQQLPTVCLAVLACILLPYLIWPS